MGKVNWARVFLGGLLSWLTMNVLTVPAWFIVAKQWTALMKTMGRSFPTPGLAAVWILVTFVLGMVSIWLYAAIRPRYGPGPKTAALVGLVVLVILGLADAIWISLAPAALLEPVPTGLIVKCVVCWLVIIPVATIVGAWPYKE
jgi:hypothetical protein